MSIKPAHLPPEIQAAGWAARHQLAQPAVPAGADLEQVEREHIRQVLRQTQWNRGEASRILGLHRNTLREKIRRMGLENQEI
jgi:DNA-binding NtrC family response regulator